MAQLMPESCCASIIIMAMINGFLNELFTNISFNVTCNHCVSSSLECNWQKRGFKNLWDKLHRLLFLLHLVHLVVNFDCSPQPLKSCKYDRVIVNNNQFSHFQRKDQQEQVLKTFLGAVFIVFVEEKVLGRLWAEE